MIKIRQFSAFLLVTYYCLGNLCLPIGDFATLSDIPSMYHHCKSTEDKDMTPIDFLTDHLINIDCIFDNHDNGDKQKPHSPVQYHHQQQNTFYTQQHTIALKQFTTIRVILLKYVENAFLQSYFSAVFRPPIS